MHSPLIYDGSEAVVIGEQKSIKDRKKQNNLLCEITWLVFSFSVTLFQTFEIRKEENKSDRTGMIFWSQL